MDASSVRRIAAAVGSNRRALASLIAVVALIGGLLVISQVVGSDNESVATRPSRDADASSTNGSVTEDGSVIDAGGAESLDSRGADAGGSARAGSAKGGASGSRGSTSAAGSSGGAAGVDGAIPPGVTDKEIVVAYYWKGDRTKASPFLAGSGAEANIDEAKAFRMFIDYLNKHAGGGATLMGFPFNLHGRKLKGVVLEAGNSPEQYAAVAEKLAKEVKPFAAIAAHGSLSAYVCPRMAAAGIHNLSTFDVSPGLVKRTNGYCMPNGPSWDSQVDASVAYITQEAKRSKYDAPAGPEARKLGVAWSEYPGMVDSGPALVEQLKKAGAPVASSGSLSPDLATAQQQVGNLIAKFRQAGVNTIVMPDAGVPLSFTHAAQAQGYTPDYYVWPCSGMDTAGMVRLFNAAQWERAAGLTCYDAEFNPDLTNDDRMRQSEWYKQYQSIAGARDEPPGSTSLVYASLLPLVAGITHAGPDLTVENFRSGLDKFQSYRYHAIKGRTTSAMNLLLTIGAPDRSLLGDYVKLEWSNAARTSGNAQQGAYLYPEERRYGRNDSF